MDASGSIVSWFTSVLFVQKASTAWSISNSASCSPKFDYKPENHRRRLKHRASLSLAIEQVILIEFMSQTWVMSNCYGIGANQAVAPKQSIRHGDNVAEASSDQAGRHDSKSNFECQLTEHWPLIAGPSCWRPAETRPFESMSQQKHLLGWHLVLLHVCLQDCLGTLKALLWIWWFDHVWPSSYLFNDLNLCQMDAATMGRTWRSRSSGHGNSGLFLEGFWIASCTSLHYLYLVHLLQRLV